MSAIKIDKQATNILIIVAIVLVIYLLIKAGKLASIGIGKIEDIFGGGPEAKNVEKKILARDKKIKTLDPFSPQYIISRQGQKGLMYLTGAAKQKIINQIMDTGGFWRLFPEDGRPLLEVFKTISHKSQISDLADTFYKKTGKDMLSFIKDKLQGVGWMGQAERNKSLNELIEYVNNLAD